MLHPHLLQKLVIGTRNVFNILRSWMKFYWWLYHLNKSLTLHDNCNKTIDSILSSHSGRVQVKLAHLLKYSSLSCLVRFSPGTQCLFLRVKISPCLRRFSPWPISIPLYWFSWFRHLDTSCLSCLIADCWIDLPVPRLASFLCSWLFYQLHLFWIAYFAVTYLSCKLWRWESRETKSKKQKSFRTQL